MKNIIIIGGGAAGWLTALIVNKFWKDTNVVVIESSKIGILGAGEGGTPNFGGILQQLGINQNEFFKRTKSTVKGGLNLINWTGDNTTISHSFTGEKPSIFFQRYAYHFDAKLVAEYLKEVAISRGINHMDDEVSNVEIQNNLVNRIYLDSENIIDKIDYVFDCSGFKRIINNARNEEWIDYSKYLLINKAFGFFLPQEKTYTINDNTFTDVISMNAGWLFKIPLQHRWGCGYSFNDNYISVEDAKKEIEDYLGTEIKIQKVFDFKPGTYKRSWIGNTISVGLSYGFIEPLEATSLMSVILQLNKLVEINFDEDFKDDYNGYCMNTNEQNMLFVRYHYLCERFDTKFWKDSYEMPVPEKLQSILDENNNILVKNNSELINRLDLKYINLNDLSFLVSNYNTIFKKNKKLNKKELI